MSLGPFGKRSVSIWELSTIIGAVCWNRSVAFSGPLGNKAGSSLNKLVLYGNNLGIMLNPCGGHFGMISMSISEHIGFNLGPLGEPFGVISDQNLDLE